MSKRFSKQGKNHLDWNNYIIIIGKQIIKFDVKCKHGNLNCNFSSDCKKFDFLQDFNQLVVKKTRVCYDNSIQQYHRIKKDSFFYQYWFNSNDRTAHKFRVQLSKRNLK